MGDPLPIPRPDRFADRMLVHGRKVFAEARIPLASPRPRPGDEAVSSTTVVQKQVGHTIVQFPHARHRRSISVHATDPVAWRSASRADSGLIRKAMLCAAVSIVLGGRCRVGLGRRRGFELLEQPLPQFGTSARYETALTRHLSLGEREIEAGRSCRPCPHGGAEARRSGYATVHSHHNGVGAGRRVRPICERAVTHHAVHDRTAASSHGRTPMNALGVAAGGSAWNSMPSPVRLAVKSVTEGGWWKRLRLSGPTAYPKRASSPGSWRSR